MQYQEDQLEPVENQAAGPSCSLWENSVLIAARQLLTHIILKKVTTYRAIKITTYELKFLDVNVDDRRGPLFRGT